MMSSCSSGDYHDGDYVFFPVWINGQKAYMNPASKTHLYTSESQEPDLSPIPDFSIRQEARR